MARTYSTAQIAQGLREAGFPEPIIPTMTAVIQAESSGNPFAHNPSAPDDSYGLAQINMYGGLEAERLKQFGLKSKEQLFDPATNLRAAKQIYDQQGLGAWGAYTNGSYKKFLGQTSAGGQAVSLPKVSQSTVSRLAGSHTTGLDPNGIGIDIDPALPTANQVALGGLGVDMSKVLSQSDRMAGGMDNLGSIFAVATQAPSARMAGIPELSALTSGRAAAPSAQAGSSTFVTGNTGESTGPHLDFRVWDKKKGGYVSNPGDYAHLVTTADGTPVNKAFQMTSPYGMRNHPVHGGRKLHEGIDYATPSGTKLNVWPIRRRQVGRRRRQHEHLRHRQRPRSRAVAWGLDCYCSSQHASRGRSCCSRNRLTHREP